jgi:hypothetical protein
MKKVFLISLLLKNTIINKVSLTLQLQEKKMKIKSILLQNYKELMRIKVKVNLIKLNK